MERDFKGIWIPKELYLNNELSWAEKILLVEIDSLDKDNQGCFASNEYLAKFLMLSEGSVANMIIKLIDKGYIIKKGFDGRKRYISINNQIINLLNQNSYLYESRVHKNMNPEFTKTLTLDSQKYEHSNTINKTNNNTFKKESKKNFTLSFPSEFSQRLIDKINEFFEYRKEIKKQYKSEKSANQFILSIQKELKNYGEDIIIDSFDNSIANGWQGFFIKKDLINKQTILKDAKGKYADTNEGRKLFISNIREGASRLLADES